MLKYKVISINSAISDTKFEEALNDLSSSGYTIQYISEPEIRKLNDKRLRFIRVVAFIKQNNDEGELDK